MTLWAYYRVSSDFQNYKSQKIGVLNWCKQNKYGMIDKEVIDDGVSGTVLAKDRALNRIVKNSKSGDILIVSELSRIGRSTADVLNTLNKLAEKGVEVHFVKQNMKMDNSPMGKMMVAIMSAFAELERDLISQRTIEGLARVKSEGKTLGRPVGTKNTNYKLDGCEELVKEWLAKGKAKAFIAKRLNVHRSSLYHFIKKYINNEVLK
ncbi:MAG: recombinase family protein [Alphaproteobacteria bacterium]|nr:recombinase family protein [Alphaproteobacteria bacterium]